MPTYKAYQQQLDALNALVGNVGGPIPSEVSDALGAMQAAQAAGNTAEAQKQFNKAVEANKKNGVAWGAVQQWHDQVATQPITPTNPGDPDPEPEYPTGGSWPPTMGKYQTSDWAPVAPNTVLWTQATADTTVSSAEGSGGRAVYGTVGDAIATIPFPQDSNVTSSGMGATSKKLPIKAGQFYSSYFEPDGYGQPSTMRCTT